VPRGEGWWIASDGKWYPPYLHPDVLGVQGETNAPKAEPEDADEDATPLRSGSPWPGWEEVASDQGLPRSQRAESLAYPDGWWLASDGNWYPPELHPNAARGNGQARSGNGHAHPEVVNTLGGELPAEPEAPEPLSPSVQSAAEAATAEAALAEAAAEAAEAAAAEAVAAAELAAAAAEVAEAAAEAASEEAGQVAPEPEPEPAPAAAAAAPVADEPAAAAIPLAAATPHAAPDEDDSDSWSLAIEAVKPAGVTGRRERRRRNLVALGAVLALVVGGSIAGVVAGTSSPSRPHPTAAQLARQDRKHAGEIELRLLDMPSGWLPAAPLPSRAPSSPNPFTAGGRAALQRLDPSCAGVAASFGAATTGADASTTTDYQTPLGGSKPSYGALESEVIFFPTDRLAKDDVARLSDSKASCVGEAVRALLQRDLIPGTAVTVQTSTSRPVGLTSSQSGFEFTVTGTVSNSGATYPLRFVIEGTTGSRGVVLVFSGSVAGGGSSPHLEQVLFSRLAERVRRFDP